MAAVSGLYTLAKRGSHYWSEDSVAELITVAGTTDSEKLVGYIFDITIILTQSPAVCHMYYNPGKIRIINTYLIELIQR